MPRDAELHYDLSETPPDGRDPAVLIRTAAHSLRVDPEQLIAARLRRVSLDARRRHRGWNVVIRTWQRGESVPPDPGATPPRVAPVPKDAPTVVVIGSGPAGLFSALDLLAGGVRAIVLERGGDVRARRRSIRAVLRGEHVDPDCNYCFGEGGAGTYSDGKLYSRSGSKRDVSGVLETLVAHGAPQEILWSWRPHIGSNKLPALVAALRGTIQAAGGEVRFGRRAEALEIAADGDSRRITAVVARDTKSAELERIACQAAVLATGHSALDAVRMAARAGARLEPKGFAMGVRIEHPQGWLDARQYAGLSAHAHLPPAIYELTSQADGAGVYSFCMCPGGFIVPATTADERVVVNGMSLARRDSPFANSGLVVSLEPEDWCGARGAAWGWPELLRQAARLGCPEAPRDGELPPSPGTDPLFGVRLQLALERVAANAGGGRGRAPAQRADHVLAKRSDPVQPLVTSYRPGLTPVALEDVLPAGLLSRLRTGLAEFESRLPGFAGVAGQLIGVESRTSSPVRVRRDRESLECDGVRGLYPAGEGAGFAGGIVSAALDGRRVARAILAALAQPR